MNVNLPVPTLPTLSPWQKRVLTVGIAILMGYAFGRYAQPAKIQIQTQTVIKEVQTVQHNTVTETKEVKLPNGTVEEDTTVTDKDIDTTSTQESKTMSETITNTKPQWLLQGGAGYDFTRIEPMYEVGISHRWIGPIFLGVQGIDSSTNKSVLGLVTLEF